MLYRRANDKRSYANRTTLICRISKAIQELKKKSKSGKKTATVDACLQTSSTMPIQVSVFQNWYELLIPNGKQVSIDIGRQEGSAVVVRTLEGAHPQLSAGDIIIGINGRSCTDYDAAVKAIRECKSDQKGFTIMMRKGDVPHKSFGVVHVQEVTESDRVIFTAMKSAPQQEALRIPGCASAMKMYRLEQKKRELLEKEKLLTAEKRYDEAIKVVREKYDVNDQLQECTASHAEHVAQDLAAARVASIDTVSL